MHNPVNRFFFLVLWGWVICTMTWMFTVAPLWHFAIAFESKNYKRFFFSPQTAAILFCFQEPLSERRRYWVQSPAISKMAALGDVLAACLIGKIHLCFAYLFQLYNQRYKAKTFKMRLRKFTPLMGIICGFFQQRKIQTQMCFGAGHTQPSAVNIARSLRESVASKQRTQSWNRSSLVSMRRDGITCTLLSWRIPVL